MQRMSKHEAVSKKNVQDRDHMTGLCEKSRKTIEELRDKLHSQQLAAIQNEASTKETLRNMERNASEATKNAVASASAQKDSAEVSGLIV